MRRYGWLVVLVLGVACSGCMFGPKSTGPSDKSSRFDKAKGLLSKVFRVDGQVFGTALTYKQLAPALNLLGARYGIADAGDRVVKGDEFLIDLLGTRVAEEDATGGVSEWAPVRIDTNWFCAVDGAPPIPSEKILGFYGVRSPVYPGAKTNWISFDAAKEQFRAGSEAAVAEKAAKMKAQQQALQLLTSGLLDKSTGESLAQVLGAVTSGGSNAPVILPATNTPVGPEPAKPTPGEAEVPPVPVEFGGGD